ncbi:DoxX family protein [Winogradskya humida]|uniref:Membrane protein n=1 Tax=Winogradskya humida TaxID=113566 RepID=A0ABQ3ZWI1_9ACTN|nr:MauE/DoxX family redox-associated membrane protein [Actinoplanes humidus]GIE22931.1 membrane protein [Actinoplanes humidus]
MTRKDTIQALALAGVLATSGVLHFAKPRPFDRIVPRSLPGSRRTYTYVSGAAELAIAAAIAVPRTRALGGLAAAGLFAAVFPANVKMAVDWRHASPAKRAIAYGRLPLQVPLVLWGLQVAGKVKKI